MKEFVTAVKDVGDVDEDSPITFKHDGREVTFYEPSSGQQTLMLSMGRGVQDGKSASTFLAMFFSMMEDDTRQYFEDRLMDRLDGFDLESEGGIFDIFEHLTEEWSARPTKQPSDYLPPERSTGKTSTASTRVKGSTSSRSRSRGTSR